MVVRVAVRVGSVVGMGVNQSLFVPAGLFDAPGRETGSHEGSGHERRDERFHDLNSNRGAGRTQVQVWRVSPTSG